MQSQITIGGKGLASESIQNLRLFLYLLGVTTTMSINYLCFPNALPLPYSVFLCFLSLTLPSKLNNYSVTITY